ncbi:hypothetical protein K469DRAFT_234957 [Zopfia rhizophila CBS 207.26]|uniref:Uncharacterized protein n=1 Tax=Zopfia rhizophila CBS 207.26 TaxID=1314779 RepID=A0A6A6ERM5_9PEZI|nr:hypothetical protein K469DRAFT_234957 [Zopfia rhizophila CBS 207.26]
MLVTAPVSLILAFHQLLPPLSNCTFCSSFSSVPSIVESIDASASSSDLIVQFSPSKATQRPRTTCRVAPHHLAWRQKSPTDHSSLDLQPNQSSGFPLSLFYGQKVSAATSSTACGHNNSLPLTSALSLSTIGTSSDLVQLYY